MKRPELKTMENLEAAFAGESMAHIKYRYFAKLARFAGDEETAKAFEETADQEVQHAFGHLDLIYPKAEMTPERCLEIAIAGETYEYTEMYPGMAKDARSEGFADVAEWFETLAKAEKSHAGRFSKGLNQVAGKEPAEAI